MAFHYATLLLSIASLVSAQYGGYGGGGGGGGNPYSGGGGGNSGFGSPNFDYASYMSQRQKILTAHGVLAALAFVIFFPMGSILIRLASFPGLWLVHGLFQIFAYVVYIAAFGCGVWIVRNIPVDLLGHYHPVIGILVFVLIFFQPILGYIHHVQFKKYSRRTVWSYGHLWLGRIVITLGMINGGLGMLLATETGFFAPSRGQKIAYGVVAAIMWLAWVASALVGESKRSKAHKRHAEVGKQEYAYDTREENAYRY